MGAYLEKPVTEKVSADGVGRAYAYGSSSMQGWRSNMEDSHINMLNFDGDEGAGLFAVFDGHGGSEVAKYCEVNVPQHVVTTTEYKEGKFELALRQSFLGMDENILRDWPRSLRECSSNSGSVLSRMTPSMDGGDPHQEGGAGCTATACIVKNNRIWVANAGDSRIVLCRGGRAIELTQDHKPELDSERARIEKAGGYVNDGRVNGNLNLTRAVGDFAYKKDTRIGPEAQIISAFAEVSDRDVADNDEFILLGCDGIWDRKTSQEIVDFVKPILDKRRKSEKSLSAVVEDLLDAIISPNVAATDGLGCDNMSAVLVDLMNDRRDADGAPLPHGAESGSIEGASAQAVKNAPLQPGLERRVTTTLGHEESTELQDAHAKADGD